MKSQGQTVSSDIYNLPEGAYQCETSFGGAVCQRFNQTLPIQNPVTQAEGLVDLSEKGAAAISSAGTRTIMGRQCNVILADYDVNKVMEEYGNVSLPEDLMAGIKEMKESVCFDSESGLPLEYDQSIRVDAAEGSASSIVHMTATMFELSAPEVKMPEDAVIY